MCNDVCIMYDTCTFSYLMNGKLANKDIGDKNYQIASQGFLDLIMTGMCLIVSDLTFIEVMSGCNNQHELLRNHENFEKCEFVILCSNLKNKKIIEELKNEKKYSEMNDIREKMMICKHETLKPIFSRILQKYCELFYVTLYSNDQKWADLYNAFLIHVREQNAFWINRVDEYYFEVNRGPKKKNVLFNFAVTYSLDLIYMYNLDYTTEQLVEYFRDININNFTSQTKKIINAMRSYLQLSKEYDKEKTKVFMLVRHQNLKKKFSKSQNINYILEDATNYVVGLELFEGRAFELNDLVDIYNVSLIEIKDKKIKYYTNDKKWRIFLDYEKEVNIEFYSKMQEIDEIIEIQYKINEE